MSAEARLKSLGLELPPLPKPGGNYIPGTLHNGILYLSGQGPILADGSLATGVVAKDVTIDEAIPMPDAQAWCFSPRLDISSDLSTG